MTQEQQRAAQDMRADEEAEAGRSGCSGGAGGSASGAAEGGRPGAGADVREGADAAGEADAAAGGGEERERVDRGRVQGDGEREGGAGGSGRAGGAEEEAEGGAEGGLPQRQGHHRPDAQPAGGERGEQERRRFRGQAGEHQAEESGNFSLCLAFFYMLM